MKQTFFISTAILIALAIGCHTLTSYTSNKLAESFWKQLGLSEMDGKKDISESFKWGWLHWYEARNAKNIAVSNREAITKDLLTYTKQFVSSNAFQKEYTQFRNSSKPVEPEAAKTKEDVRKKFICDAEDAKKNLEKALTTATDASLKKVYAEQVDYWAKQIADYKNPDSKYINDAFTGEQTQYKWRYDEYQKSLKSWAGSYPETVSQLVKARLQNFLDVTKDVDYSAELKDKNGKKVFVNPKYEAKPNNWKMAFRAGKEVTETARVFAEQWLKELK